METDTNFNRRFRSSVRNMYVMNTPKSWVYYKKQHPEIVTTIRFAEEVAKDPADFLQLLVTDGLSYNQVAQEMNLRGYKTHKGRPFNTAAVKSVAMKTLDTLVVRN